jgi:DnaJ-class molecular chaperone
MAPDDPTPDTQCRPCRGTGRLISNLGGSPSEVTCPWCEGSGQFQGTEYDAQAAGVRLRGDQPGA